MTVLHSRVGGFLHIVEIAAEFVNPLATEVIEDKITIIVGAGQSPDEGLGDGRSTVLRFAQEVAKVMTVDTNLSWAIETVAVARQSGGERILQSEPRLID
jgi:hypothetical protein